MTLPGRTVDRIHRDPPFTPANRNNLIGWIAASKRREHYGEAVVYDFPKTKLNRAPRRSSAHRQNAQLSGQLSLWNQTRFARAAAA